MPGRCREVSSWCSTASARGSSFFRRLHLHVSALVRTKGSSIIPAVLGRGVLAQVQRPPRDTQ